jgi:predicted nuclease with TOPRIM domain
MNLTEKLTAKYSEQSEENAQLQVDISFLQSEYKKEQQMRHQFEKKFNEANKLIEMVKVLILKFNTEDCLGSFKTHTKTKKLCFIS